MSKRQPNLHESLRFVSSAEACAILSVTSQTLRRWARNGQISALRTPGGRYRYNLAGLIVAATPEPKRAKAPRTLVQPQTAVPAPSPSPEVPKALAAPVEPLEALIAPPAPKLVPMAPFSAEALRAQIERLSQSSAW
jgi:excisionase family DNA binding protein